MNDTRKLTTAVIAGPTGTIGIALCARLLREGLTVYAVCRPGSPGIDSLPKHERLHVVSCDAANYRTLPDLIDKADAFFYFTWTNTIGAGRNNMPAQINNIRSTLDAVHAAHQLGCSVWIGAGSQAEYGRVSDLLRPDAPAFPENGYGMAKLCAGQMSRVECKTLGMAHIWPRILSVYGPHDDFAMVIPATIRTLLAGDCPKLTAGEQKWDYLFAEDAAEAYWRMAQYGRDGAVYPLGSGRARPLREYMTALRDAIDPALPLGLGEIPYGPQQVMHLQADITALQRDTGFVPAVDFETGIRKTIEWVRSTNQ